MATDAAYRHLVKFVNALAMVSGTTDYDALAKFLNEHIDRFKHEVLPKKKKGGKKPSDGDKPGDGKKPGDGGKTPDGKKPGGDAAKPGDGGDGKDKPGDGKDKPGGKGQGNATITPKK